MSSFTHYLEAEVLQDHIKQSLYLGLSRTDGNRQGLFAVWGSDGEGGKKITTEGIDEPGEGWFKDPEDDIWKTEATASLGGGYARVAIAGTDWHDVEVVLGAEGDSELRLSDTKEFGPATTGANWGNITHFFLADSDTIGEGNILAWGSMPDSYAVVEGMTAKLWANTIVVRMTD